MHIYECTNKGTQYARKKNILQYEIQKKSHNNNNLGKKTRLYSPYICAIYIRT